MEFLLSSEMMSPKTGILLQIIGVGDESDKAILNETLLFVLRVINSCMYVCMYVCIYL